MLTRARCAGDDLVRRALDRMPVDPDDRQRRPQPEPLVQRGRRIADEVARRAATPWCARTRRGGRRSPRSARARPRRADGARAIPPSIATSPCSSTSDASTIASAITGSGTAPPAMPECCGPSSARSSMSAAASPRNEYVSAGHADVPVPGVGEHQHVGAQLVEVRVEERVQRRRADLLFALDQDAHVARQLARACRATRRPRARARRRPPCRRRCRARRAGRRVPRARTDRSPSSRRSPGGCTSWCAYNKTVGASGPRASTRRSRTAAIRRRPRCERSRARARAGARRCARRSRARRRVVADRR